MTKRKTLTLGETAKVLGVAKGTAYKAVRSGQLPAIRLGRRLLIPTAALDALLRNPQHQKEERRPND